MKNTSSDLLLSGSRHLSLVEVQAGLTWEAALKYRIYSCPDDSSHFSAVFGATDLLLNNRANGRRIPLNIQSVQAGSLTNPDFVEKVPERFRTRLLNYKNAVQGIPGILESYPRHRFYFLSNEPWPEWLQQLTVATSNLEWNAFLSVCAEPARFFRWPTTGKTRLFWEGCVRGDENQRHEYPPEVAEVLLRLGLQFDTRNNGPAIMAYLAAGGVRPGYGIGHESWHIHHIYDGTCPVHGVSTVVPHAVHEENLFTHSAGLVAAHPIAHQFAHQCNLLKWILRREAFQRFDGFDPMGVFTDA